MRVSRGGGFGGAGWGEPEVEVRKPELWRGSGIWREVRVGAGCLGGSQGGLDLRVSGREPEGGGDGEVWGSVEPAHRV